MFTKNQVGEKLKYFIERADRTLAKKELRSLLSEIAQFESELIQQKINKGFELKIIREKILTKLYKEKIIL